MRGNWRGNEGEVGETGNKMSERENTMKWRETRDN